MKHAPATDPSFDLDAFLEHARTHFGLRTSTDRPSAATAQRHSPGKGLLFAAALGAVLATPAWAEYDCRTMGGPGGPGGPERHARMVEQHHQRLHDALKLTPEQESGWKKLMETQDAMHRPGRPPADDWSKLTAPERADKMLAMSRAHNEQLSEHVGALKNFYASLSAEQKKTFDDMHVRQSERMRGKPGGRPAAADKPLPNG